MKKGLARFLGESDVCERERSKDDSKFWPEKLERWRKLLFTKIKCGRPRKRQRK